MGILPKVESKAMLVALEPVQAQFKSQRVETRVCQRFMLRGNDPVASNYEDKEMQHLKPNDLVIIPSIEPKNVAPGTKPKHFEEEVSGINLSKLFSVYGP
jgi:hypothetical protein